MGVYKHKKSIHSGITFYLPLISVILSLEKKSNLKKHKDVIHIGIQFSVSNVLIMLHPICILNFLLNQSIKALVIPVDQCDSTFANKRGLKTYKKSTRWGKISMPTMCEKEFPARYLNSHVKVHEGVRYPS